MTAMKNVGGVGDDMSLGREGGREGGTYGCHFDGHKKEVETERRREGGSEGGKGGTGCLPVQFLARRRVP